MEKSKVVFRVDGSAQIGLGHLVRCIALAQMLCDIFEITFISRDIPLQIVKNLKDNNFTLYQIDDELSFFSEIQQGDILVLDGYDFDIEYQKKIKSKDCKLVCIDDLHDQEFVADLIINHAPGLSVSNYRAQAYTQFALGPEYALLRPAFLNQSKIQTKTLEKNDTVLICFGGLDHKNISLISLQVVLGFERFKKIILITGASYQFFDTIETIIKNDKRIVYYHAIDEDKMVELMRSADIVIVPASGILLESLAVGPIIISGMYTDNQKLIFERYKNSGAFISAESFSYDDLYKAVNDALLKKNNHTLFFDGLSGKRILKKFFALTLTLRKATADDCELLFNWVNDQSVRANAINKESILWEKHKLWYASKIKSADTYLLILQLSGKPVGQVRYEREGDCLIVDYSIDKEYRNQGLGKIILEKSLEYLSGKSIKAYVLPGNLASAKIFESLEFIQTETETVNDVICNVYQLHL